MVEAEKASGAGGDEFAVSVRLKVLDDGLEEDLDGSLLCIS